MSSYISPTVPPRFKFPKGNQEAALAVWFIASAERHTLGPLHSQRLICRNPTKCLEVHILELVLRYEDICGYVVVHLAEPITCIYWQQSWVWLIYEPYLRSENLRVNKNIQVETHPNTISSSVTSSSLSWVSKCTTLRSQLFSCYLHCPTYLWQYVRYSISILHWILTHPAAIKTLHYQQCHPTRKCRIKFKRKWQCRKWW